MINSILNSDAYIFSMQQFILKKHPGNQVKYKFIDRTPRGDFTPEMFDLLCKSVEDMSSLLLTDSEASFLRTLPWVKEDYLEWLKNFRFDPTEVFLSMSNGKLNIEIDGVWERAIMWEVPLLALISEIYFKDKFNDVPEHINNTISKCELMRKHDIQFIEFGTRRRRSYAYQDSVVGICRSYDNCLGTSNLHFAQKYGLKSYGSQAHQIYQAFSGLYGVKDANIMVCKEWLEFYGEHAGVALTDTFTTEVFWRDFEEFAHKYVGVRQDSGNPNQFVHTTLKNYMICGVDTKTKTILFSDGLNPEKCIKLNDKYKHIVQCRFGIGTNLTNLEDHLNIVIKLDEIEGVKVVKLSDQPEKASGNPSEVLRVKKVLGI